MFFEPDGGTGDNPVPPPKVFTSQFITEVVRKSIANGDIPADHKLAFLGAVDEKGVRAIVSVQIVNKPDIIVRVQSVVEHEWTGDNKAGAQVLFSMR